MNEFIAERATLVRQLADRADPFTKVRLLQLAAAYDQRLGPQSKHVPQRKEPIGLLPTSKGASKR